MVNVCPDMPAITLLPAKIVNDLRIIADYLVKSPGDNHTGMCMKVRRCMLFTCMCPCRHHEPVCSDKVQPVGEGYELSPSEQPRRVLTPSLCKILIDLLFLFINSIASLAPKEEQLHCIL